MGILYWQLPLGDGSGAAAFCDCIADRIALMLFTVIFMMLGSVLPTIITVLPELAVMKKEYLNNWCACISLACCSSPRLRAPLAASFVDDRRCV